VLNCAIVNVRLSVPYLELHCLVQAAHTWGAQWTGKCIIFRCDAMSALHTVNRRSARRDNMAELLRHLVTLAATHCFDFRCEHIPGAHNVVADRFSRGCDFSELITPLPSANLQPTPALAELPGLEYLGNQQEE
jgi:hypothetical protein